MDGPRDYHTKWNKADREKTDAIWYHLYMETKIRHIQIYLWNRNRLTDLENRPAAAGGWGGVGEGLGVWDEQI